MKRAVFALLFSLLLAAPVGAQEVPSDPFADEEPAPPPRRPRVEPAEAPARPRRPPVEAAPAVEPEPEVAPAEEAGDLEAAQRALEQALDEPLHEEAELPEEAPVVEAAPEPAPEAEPEIEVESGAHGPGANVGEAEHGGAEHEGAHEAHFDATQFAATVVNFVLLIGILIFLARKPLTEHLRNRRREVEEALVEARRLTEEAQAKHAEYSTRLAQMDVELERMRKEMIQAGENERDRIIAEAEARAARMRKEAQFLIDQRQKQLRADLTNEAIEAAIAAATKLLAESAGAPDQVQLADHYLGQLEGSMREEVRG